jgi:hypothetical protein
MACCKTSICTCWGSCPCRCMSCGCAAKRRNELDAAAKAEKAREEWRASQPPPGPFAAGCGAVLGICFLVVLIIVVIIGVIVYHHLSAYNGTAP